MKQEMNGKQQAQDPMRSREPLKHAHLAFTAIWIIIITCTLTNLLVLRRPVLMLTVIPIALCVMYAHRRAAVVRAADILKARKPGNG